MLLKSTFKVIAVVALCTQLGGCWLALGRGLAMGELRLLAGRAGVAEAAAIGMRAGIGGEALAATRVAQANMGAVIAQDVLLSRLAARSVRLQIGQGTANSGRAFLANGEVRVAMADGAVMRVTNPQMTTRFGRSGMYSDHIVNGERISFTRYSPNSIRMDYFVRDARTGSYSSPMYALRDPSGNSIAFFGRNHSYMGTAVYNTGRSGASSGTAAAAVAYVVLNDFQGATADDKCSPELLILRRTYYNEGVTNETPDQFWASFYRDCQGNEEVRADYQRFLLDKLSMEENPSTRYSALQRFLNLFPQNVEAKNMKLDMERNGL